MQLIKDNSTGLFLFGFDGQKYEWSDNPRGAWNFVKGSSQLFKRIAKVREQHPAAVEVSRLSAYRERNLSYRG